MSIRARRLAVSLTLLTTIATDGAPTRAQTCTPRWDPSPGYPGTSAAVYTTFPLPSGDVVIGGAFATSGGLTTNRIARYRPSTNSWFAYGAGFSSGGVTSLTTTSGGDLIAGGSTVQSGFISRWNAVAGTWTTTPNIGGSVNALLTLPDGSIIVGSTSSSSIPSPISPIGKYNPNTGIWSAWTFDFGPQVYVLVRAANGDVYAAGNNIQRLDAASNTWFPVAAPTGGGIFYSLSTLPGGDLITCVQSGPNKGILRMDTSTGVWTQMGSLLVPHGTGFAVSASGEIFAFGSFVIDTNTQSSDLIRWDPGAGRWLPVAGAPPTSGNVGEDAHINVLSNGDFLFSGGFIFVAANRTTRNLVLWTTRPTCRADFNCSGTLDSQDVLDFITAWFNADPRADFNRAAGPQVSDIFDFLNTWFAGC